MYFFLDTSTVDFSSFFLFLGRHNEGILQSTKSKTIRKAEASLTGGRPAPGVIILG